MAGADLRTLRRLAGKSLLHVLPADRFEVHELLRQYGEEKLRQAELLAAVRQAHGVYYLAFLAARDEDIKGRRQQAGLREIRADFENVRQAWLWAVEHAQIDAISRAALECLRCNGRSPHVDDPCRRGRGAAPGLRGGRAALPRGSVH